MICTVFFATRPNECSPLIRKSTPPYIYIFCGCPLNKYGVPFVLLSWFSVDMDLATSVADEMSSSAGSGSGATGEGFEDVDDMDAEAGVDAEDDDQEEEDEDEDDEEQGDQEEEENPQEPPKRVRRHSIAY